MAILIVGYGDTGQRIIDKLSQPDIYTLRRSPVTNNSPITPIIADLDQADSYQQLLQQHQHWLIYYLAPPAKTSLHETRVQHFIEQLSSQQSTARIVYISTSGVYGDRQGAWVDETVDVRPETDRAKRRVSAEQQWLKASQQYSFIESIILRVPGIYGPSRLPVTKASEVIIKPDESPVTNLIHIDDLATICITAMHKGHNGDIYNVSDGTPIHISEYYQLVAKVARLPEPVMISYQQAQRQFSAERLSFLNESRRLDTSKLFNQLAVKLHYPLLLDGIIASI